MTGQVLTDEQEVKTTRPSDRTHCAILFHYTISFFFSAMFTRRAAMALSS